MKFDTEILGLKTLELVKKHGRETVFRAEKFALEQAAIFRPLTEAWINCFLRERDVFCGILSKEKPHD